MDLSPNLKKIIHIIKKEDTQMYKIALAKLLKISFRNNNLSKITMEMLGNEGIHKLMEIYNKSQTAIFRKLAIYLIINLSKNISDCYEFICHMLNSNPFSGILILNMFPNDLKNNVIKNSRLLKEIKTSNIKEEKDFWNFPEYDYDRNQCWQTKLLNYDLDNSSDLSNFIELIDTAIPDPKLFLIGVYVNKYLENFHLVNKLKLTIINNSISLSGPNIINQITNFNSWDGIIKTLSQKNEFNKTQKSNSDKKVYPSKSNNIKNNKLKARIPSKTKLLYKTLHKKFLELRKNSDNHMNKNLNLKKEPNLSINKEIKIKNPVENMFFAFKESIPNSINVNSNLQEKNKSFFKGLNNKTIVHSNLSNTRNGFNLLGSKLNVITSENKDFLQNPITVIKSYLNEQKPLKNNANISDRYSNSPYAFKPKKK